MGARELRAAGFVGCFLLALCLCACSSKVTKENFDKIQDGMTLEEVEKILGSGTLQGDGSGTAAQFGIHLAPGGSRKTQVYTWDSDDKRITVYIVGGTVKGKNQKGL